MYSRCLSLTNLVCVLFDPAIPTSSFNFIVFILVIHNYKMHPVSCVFGACSGPPRLVYIHVHIELLPISRVLEASLSESWITTRAVGLLKLM